MHLTMSIAHLYPHCSLLACCPDPWLFCTIRNQLHSAINCLLQNPFSHNWHHLPLLCGLFPLKYIICRRCFRQLPLLTISWTRASWSRWFCRFFRHNWTLSRLQASRSRSKSRLGLKQLVGNDSASVWHFWTLFSAIFSNLEDNDLIFYCILWWGKQEISGRGWWTAPRQLETTLTQQTNKPYLLRFSASYFTLFQVNCKTVRRR